MDKINLQYKDTKYQLDKIMEEHWLKNNMFLSSALFVFEVLIIFKIEEQYIC